MLKIVLNQSAYQAGYNACVSAMGDLQLAVNPYSENSLSSFSWQKAWQAALSKLPVVAY